jgi:hypothetical protein
MKRRYLRKAEYVIYDQFVSAFSEPPTEPPILLAQINRPSTGGFFVPGKHARPSLNVKFAETSR